MDAATGQVIYARDMDARRSPASTTKIMTLILALENSNLDDVVTVSSNAAGTEGSTIWLEAGEKLRMGDLLYGMMMHSGMMRRWPSPNISPVLSISSRS